MGWGAAVRGPRRGCSRRGVEACSRGSEFSYKVMSGVQEQPSPRPPPRPQPPPEDEAARGTLRLRPGDCTGAPGVCEPALIPLARPRLFLAACVLWSPFIAYNPDCEMGAGTTSVFNAFHIFCCCAFAVGRILL